MSDHTRYIECYACGAENAAEPDPQQRDFPFTRGYALATALIMRTHHDECITREVALSFGGGGDGGLRALWAREGVDPYDLEVIDVAFTGGSKYERDGWHGKVPA